MLVARPSHELGTPEAPSFIEGMDRAAIVDITTSLDPISRVNFWSTFQSTVDLPFPSAATLRTIDDVAAVIAGSKLATIFVPGTFDRDRLVAERFLDEEYNRLSSLAYEETRDAYGDLKGFLGQVESVTTLAELYEGRGGKDTLRPADEAFHRAVGAALGYSIAAIDDFIERTTK